MEDHEEGGTARYEGCAECAHGTKTGYDAVVHETLEGVTARFGDNMARRVHGILHDPNYRWAHDLIPWPWTGAGTQGRPDGLQSVTDRYSPGIDEGTLRSLIRLWDDITSMDHDHDPGGQYGRIRVRRLLSLIMTAGLTDREPAGHRSADGYAAAAIIAEDINTRPVRTPGLGVDDISGLIEDMIHAYGGYWSGMHSQTVNDNLAALTVMRRHGAPVTDLTRIIDVLMDDSALMVAVMADGRKADAGYAETVLAFHERTGGDREEEKRIIGWGGNMYDMAIRRGHSGKVAAAMVEAAMRVEDGGGMDPRTEAGRAACGRAITLLSEVAAKTIKRDMRVVYRLPARDALDIILVLATEKAADDPDMMDMIVSIARMGTMLDAGRFESITGPLLKAGRPGVEALADAVKMHAEGLPDEFVTETALSACMDIGDHGPDFAHSRLGSRLVTRWGCGHGHH